MNQILPVVTFSLLHTEIGTTVVPDTHKTDLTQAEMALLKKRLILWANNIELILQTEREVRQGMVE